MSTKSLLLNCAWKPHLGTVIIKKPICRSHPSLLALVALAVLGLTAFEQSVSAVPVIVLSALDPSRAADVNANAFLKKPLDFDRLLTLVRGYCR